MLNVPSSIQNLYLTDGVRKNFRAHFPNGEFPDITNENVVQESLKFTESLCSQSVFKFGLAEASVLEFETVGYANMFGMKIEASIEIDTSSLSAAQISAIQADEGDGTLVLASASDIGFGFYRIPLGTFIVESCPRNHEAMTHRRVTAYAELLGANIPLSPLEAIKFQDWKQDDYGFTMELNRLIDASLGYFSPNILYDLGYTRSQVTTFNSLSKTTVNETELLFTIAKGSDTYTFSLYGTHSYREYTGVQMQSVYGVELDGFETVGAANFIKNILETNDLDWTTAQIPVTIIRSYTFPTNYDIFMATFTKAVPVFAAGGGYGITKMPTRAPLYVDAPSVYACQGMNYPGAGTSGYVYFPESYTLRVEKQGSWTQDYVFDRGTANPKIYKWNKTMTDIVISPPVTISKRFTVRLTTQYNVQDDWTQHALPAEFTKLVNGYVELLGGFLSARRKGGYEFTRLKTAVDADIGKHYSEAWWDEYDIAPIGKIILSYQDSTSGEIETELEVGTGASVYDMKDNEILKGTGRTLTEVSNFINESFVPNIGAAYFTPIDFSYPCLPWHEAGDKIKFQSADDSEEVESYLLRVESTGIQNIFSHAESDGGAILTEV